MQADTAASGGEKTQMKPEGTGSEESAEFRFFIKEADGLVNIYREDGTTLYETTDIPGFPAAGGPAPGNPRREGRGHGAGAL